MIDLRSDTLTRPCPGMRRAMAEAEVGDDVYREDPTVRRLEEVAAGRVGHEAALFVPTGTMGNQIALHLWARPGQGMACDRRAHVLIYEMGAAAAWSGLTAQPFAHDPVAGETLPTAAGVEAAIVTGRAFELETGVVALENSLAVAGGRVIPPEHFAQLVATAKRHGLPVHLDGARVWNASASCEVPVTRFTEICDSVMFCLSKGLGAPVGSLLCGSTDFIDRAREVRKRMGGGMRQAGILAAAGLYALEHNVEGLVADHHRARRLAEVLSAYPEMNVRLDEVETNFVIARPGASYDIAGFVAALKERGVLASRLVGGRVRFATHRDIDDGAIERAVAIVREVAAAPAR